MQFACLCQGQVRKKASTLFHFVPIYKPSLAGGLGICMTSSFVSCLVGNRSIQRTMSLFLSVNFFLSEILFFLFKKRPTLIILL